MFAIDVGTLTDRASATHLLIDAIRMRDQARKMMLRLWPEVSALREALEPLEAEYAKWVTQHYSYEYRIAEVRKQLLSPHKMKRPPKKTQRTMTDKEAEKYFRSLSITEQAKLIGQLEALRGE